MEREMGFRLRTQSVGSCSENNLGQNLKRFQKKN